MILFLKQAVYITLIIRIKLKHYCRTDLFKCSFFPYTIAEWNKLDVTVSNAKSLLVFKNLLLKISRPIQNSISKTHDPLGTKLLTILRLGLIHLNEHRFRCSFWDCLTPLRSCSLEVEYNFIQPYQTVLDCQKNC